jgi:hypothetical protein
MRRAAGVSTVAQQNLAFFAPAIPAIGGIIRRKLIYNQIFNLMPLVPAQHCACAG